LSGGGRVASGLLLFLFNLVNLYDFWLFGLSGLLGFLLLLGATLLRLFGFGFLDRQVGECGSRLTLAWVYHANKLLRVLVDSERNLLVLKIVQGVEMTKEELPKYEVLIVEFIKLVLCDGELTLFWSLEDVF